MKKIVVLIIIIFLFFPIKVNANITCKDGTISPTCAVCSQGCCSHHGGCASSASKKGDTYNSKNNKYNNQNSNVQNGDYSFVPWVLLVLVVPLVTGMIKKVIENSDTQTSKVSTDGEKSEYELFCESVDNITNRTIVRKNIISNDTSVKYDKLSFIYKNRKINCICFAKNEVEAYHSQYSDNAYFMSSGRKVIMQNISKNLGAFELYKKEIFDYSLCATFYASDVSIYDYNVQIRNLYGFRAKKITTGNVARSKRKIEDAKQYKFKLIIRNINFLEDLEIVMNLDDLIKFSKLCQSIPIIEGENVE